MTDTLITNVQQGIIDEVSDAALDVIIQDYLNNPNNGFMDQETVTTIVTDATCTIVTIGFDSTTGDPIEDCVYLDTTSITHIDTTALISVLEWKETYLELTYNDAMKTLDKIGYLDSNSPNYPLVPYEEDLFTFDTTSSVDFALTDDTTGDTFIEYIYPVSQKIDGIYYQPGDNGIQTYPVLGSVAALGYYIGYSNDGVSWSYIASRVPVDPSHGNRATLYDDEQTSIDNHLFTYFTEDEVTDEKTYTLAFPNIAIEAKYWRIYFVDILDSLTAWSAEAGYTGYTASISHLRFQQVKEQGELIFDKTVPLLKMEGTYATGISNEGSGVSGSGWFTTLEFTYEFLGQKEATLTAQARVYADSTSSFRIRVKNETGSWVVVDTVNDLVDQYSTLIYSGNVVNPSNDLTTTWTVLVDIQDTSPAGSPNIEYRLTSTSTFRSTSEI